MVGTVARESRQDSKSRCSSVSRTSASRAARCLLAVLAATTCDRFTATVEHSPLAHGEAYEVRQGRCARLSVKGKPERVRNRVSSSDRTQTQAAATAI